MPVITIKKKVLVFIHIPKTGGSSIENALNCHPRIDLNNKKELIEKYLSGYGRISSGNKLPLQHLTFDEISNELKIRGIELFDSFSIVRHPYSRLVSSYQWHMRKYENEGRKERLITFESFVNNIDIKHTKADTSNNGPRHFLSQTSYLEKKKTKSNLKIFKLENGMQNVINWIHDEFDLRLNIGQINKSKKFTKFNSPKKEEELRKRVYSLYSEDYLNLNYEI